MNDIVMVNDANVESVIVADKPVILAIGASWCPDCRRAQPFFTQLAAVNAERAVFANFVEEFNALLTEPMQPKRREVRRAAHPDDGRAQGRQGSRPDRRGEDAGRAQGLRRAQHLTPAQVLLRISRSEISF